MTPTESLALAFRTDPEATFLGVVGALKDVSVERDAALKRVAELEEANRILRNALTRQEEICMKSHWSGSGAKP